MATCPKCGAPIPSDFGMTHCQRCQSLVFIDMEGRASIHQEEVDATGSPQVSTDSSFNHLHQDMVLSELASPASLEPADDPSHVSFNQDQISLSNEYVVDSPSASQDESHQTYDSSVDQSYDVFSDQDSQAHGDLLSSNAEKSAPPDFSHDLESQDQIFHEAPSVAPSLAETLSEVQTFANAETSNDGNGHFLYTLEIERIDSADLREQIVEALSDRRFMWDVGALSRSIQAGRLVIDGVNPVKAAILVGRIKMLPLRISWRQHAITQSAS